jgi:hypothetical protein
MPSGRLVFGVLLGLVTGYALTLLLLPGASIRRPTRRRRNGKRRERDNPLK